MKQLPIKQTGQSMTQYIIVLALVAVSAVTLFSAFGGVNRAQVSAVANEIAGNGQGAKDSIQLAQNYAKYASDSASYSRDMGNYNSSPDWSNYSGGGSSGSGSSGSGSSGSGSSGSGSSGSGSSGSGSSGTGGSGTGGSGSGGSGTGGSGTGGSGTGGSGTGGSGTGGSGSGGSGSGGSGTGGSGTGGSGSGGSGSGGSGSSGGDNNPITGIPIVEIHLASPAAGTPKTTLTRTPAKTALITTGLGAKIDKLVSVSPTLLSQLRKLIGKGVTKKWTIEFRDGKKAFTKKEETLIVLSKEFKDNIAVTMSYLAHEVGHSLYDEGPYPSITLGKTTKKEYVDAGVLRELKGEGAATINNIIVRNEIFKNTAVKDKKGIDISINSSNPDLVKFYFQTYDKYIEGKLSLVETRIKIGNFYANGEIASTTEIDSINPETKKNVKYAETYQKAYIDAWNKFISEQRAKGNIK